MFFDLLHVKELAEDNVFLSEEDRKKLQGMYRNHSTKKDPTSVREIKYVFSTDGENLTSSYYTKVEAYAAVLLCYLCIPPILFACTCKNARRMIWATGLFEIYCHLWQPTEFQIKVFFRDSDKKMNCRTEPDVGSRQIIPKGNDGVRYKIRQHLIGERKFKHHFTKNSKYKECVDHIVRLELPIRRYYFEKMVQHTDGKERLLYTSINGKKEMCLLRPTSLLTCSHSEPTKDRMEQSECLHEGTRASISYRGLRAHSSKWAPGRKEIDMFNARIQFRREKKRALQLWKNSEGKEIYDWRMFLKEDEIEEDQTGESARKEEENIQEELLGCSWIHSLLLEENVSRKREREE